MGKTKTTTTKTKETAHARCAPCTRDILSAATDVMCSLVYVHGFHGFMYAPTPPSHRSVFSSFSTQEPAVDAAVSAAREKRMRKLGGGDTKRSVLQNLLQALNLAHRASRCCSCVAMAQWILVVAQWLTIVAHAALLVRYRNCAGIDACSVWPTRGFQRERRKRRRQKRCVKLVLLGVVVWYHVHTPTLVFSTWQRSGHPSALRCSF